MADQPSDWSEVSGFYGPGAWAACILAWATTLYSIIRGPNTRTVQIAFAPVLYVHMAAIDLLMRMDDEEEFSPQSFASVAVISWGLVFQSFVCWSAGERARHGKSGLKAARQKLRAMVTLCSFLPAVAMITFVSCVWQIVFEEEAEHSQNRFAKHWLRHYIKDLFVVPIAAFLDDIYHSYNSPRDSSDGFLQICWAAACSAAWRSLDTFIVLSLMCSVPMVIILRSMPLHDSLSGTAFPFAPVAPQGIAEMDQIFALLSGVGLVLCEVLPDALRALEPRIDYIYGKFMGRRAL